MDNIRLVIAVALVFSGVVGGQTRAEAEQTIPLIQFENVSLRSAIENLGQQAEFNFTIDPKVAPDGSVPATPPLTLRWENLTAKEALARVLKERGLFLVENPQTGVAKITLTNESPRVFAQKFMDSSKDVIPMIRMTYVPLEDALANLGVKAGLKFQLNPKLVAPAKPFHEQIFVSVRFTNLTASQAVAAICDQQNLQITQSDQVEVWTISPGQ